MHKEQSPKKSQDILEVKVDEQMSDWYISLFIMK